MKVRLKHWTWEVKMGENLVYSGFSEGAKGLWVKELIHQLESGDPPVGAWERVIWTTLRACSSLWSCYLTPPPPGSSTHVSCVVAPVFVD